MNVETARDFYDRFTPEQQAQAKALIKSGRDRVSAVREVHANKLGDVMRTAQPDIDRAESDPSALEQAGAFVQGAGRVAAMGLDDEAAGVIKALGRRPGDPGVTQLYAEGRDAQLERNAEIDAGTNAAAAGEAAMTIAGPLLPGGKVIQGARAAPSIGKAILRGVGVGAGTGAVAGFGEDEGSVVGNTLKGAGAGGALGGLLGGAGFLASSKANRSQVADDVASAAQKMKDRLFAGKDAAQKMSKVDALEMLIGKERIGPVRRIEEATRPTPVMSADEAGAVIDAPNPYEGATWTPPETSSTASGLKYTPPSAAEKAIASLEETPLAAAADDPLSAMRSEVAQDWGTRPATQPRPTGGPLPDPSFAEGIAAQNSRGKVTSTTMRQTNAAEGNPSVKVPGVPTTKGDWASVLKASSPAQRAEILRNLRINNGKSFANDVAKMAGETTSTFF